MDENEKKVESQCWKTIFIAIALLSIGAVFGHVMTMKCCWIAKQCGGGYGTKACWDKGRCGQKAETGRCKPGCTCPKCLKKATCKSDPNKAGCPMMGKKEVAPETE